MVCVIVNIPISLKDLVMLVRFLIQMRRNHYWVHFYLEKGVVSHKFSKQTYIT